jgi:ArsR family transcriptional regulator
MTELRSEGQTRAFPPRKVFAYIRINGYDAPMKVVASLFKSLEDETRLRILALLLHAGELCVCDLIAVLKLPQSTVSRHLANLRNAGWLKDRRAGIWIHYSIAQDLNAERQALLETLRTILGNNDLAVNDQVRLKNLASSKCCTKIFPTYP